MNKPVFHFYDRKQYDLISHKLCANYYSNLALNYKPRFSFRSLPQLDPHFKNLNLIKLD